MILQINLRQLIEYGLDPNTYLVAYYILNKDYSTLKLLSSAIEPDKLLSIVLELERRKFIKIGYDISDNIIKFDYINVRQPLVDLLSTTLDPFDELRKVYPKTTPNERRLHGNLQKTKLKYLDFVKASPGLHELILRAVALEVKAKTKSNSLNYLQNLSTYVHQRGWEAYLDDVKQQNTTQNGGEGQEGEESGRYGSKLL